MRIVHACAYAWFILAEVVKGSLRIAANTVVGRSRPSIVEYPLQCRTDFEVMAFTSSITITPGTLVVGMAGATNGQPATIFVHSLFSTDRAGVSADLRGMENRLLRVTRKSGAR